MNRSIYPDSIFIFIVFETRNPFSCMCVCLFLNYRHARKQTKLVLGEQRGSYYFQMFLHTFVTQTLFCLFTMKLCRHPFASHGACRLVLPEINIHNNGTYLQGTGLSPVLDCLLLISECFFSGASGRCFIDDPFGGYSHPEYTSPAVRGSCCGGEEKKVFRCKR